MKTGLLSVFFVVLCALPVLADDSIERSCSGAYRLHLGAILNSSGAQLIPIGDVIGGVTNPDGSFGFTARRGCGATVPNRCRRRAGEAAMACMEAHAKAPATMPPQCTSDGVRDYKIKNLESTLRARVCDAVRKRGIDQSILPRPYYVSVTIKGMVWGDSGCGGGDRRDEERDLSYLRIACPADWTESK